MIGRRTLRLLGLLVVLSVPAHAQGTAQLRDPQTPRDSARADQAEGTAVLGGEVIRGDGPNTPLRYAVVVLLGVRTGTAHVTSTGPDGRFVVRGLPADDYLVGASKPPYLGAVAGSKGLLGPGAAITLAAGQTRADIRIALFPGAVIAGTVTDGSGRPARAEISLMQWRNQDGRTLVPVGNRTTHTDATGHYRFYGLLPGEYVVGGTPPSLPLAIRALADTEVDAALRGTAPSASPAGKATRSVPTYFPGTARIADAQAITVGVGEAFESADFRVQERTASKIEGTVASADGSTPPRTFIRIVSTVSGPQVLGAAQQSGPDGRFTFPEAFPGSYLLQAIPMIGGDPRTGTATVEVADGDISGVQIVLASPLNVSGRVVFAGTTPPPPSAGWRIPIRSLDAAATAPANLTPTDASGRFTVNRLIPGRYLLGAGLILGPVPNNTAWALESVAADGRDVTDLPVDLTADHPPAEVVVTFSDRWQSLSGKLSAPAGTSPSDYTVVVFPADKAYWLSGSRRIAVARPSSDGFYTVGGPGPLSLPAGAYLVAATADGTHDPRADPAVLAALASAALPVSLAPGAEKTQDLVIR